MARRSNWVGSLEMILLGRLLVLAVDKLTTIDFTPKALRAAPKQAGEKLILPLASSNKRHDLKLPEACGFPETTNAGRIIAIIRSVGDHGV